MKKFSLFILFCVMVTTVFCESADAFIFNVFQPQRPVRSVVSPVVKTVQAVFDVADEELQCLQLVNEERIRRKLPILTYDASLTEDSRNWSKTMTRSGFRHGAGREIIAMGGHSAAFAYRIWMNSPPHRAQLMNPHYKATGFGMSNGYWTGRFR